MKIKYSQGIKPYGRFSLLGYFIFALCFLILVMEMVFGVFENIANVVWVIITLPLSALIFLRGEGVEIDTELNRIRSYRAYYGLRFGKWHKFSDYNQLSLRIARYKLVFDVPKGSTIVEHHHDFELWIIGAGVENELLISGSESYFKGLEQAKKVSKQLGLPYQDDCLNELNKSIERRKSRRR